MNLLDLMIKISVDDRASAAVERIGDAAKKSLDVAVKASAALGAAFVGLVGSATSVYAEYEQLVGGVDTLFKDSSGALQKYAANAYKTAGMSANQYMEQATSFAASLTQSLEGDTRAAVEYANMAISDMSDNANKMGTDIGRITDAYQGFAKQNFSMLDNLKLGYGGTKTEMERLIADAERLSGLDLDISSFADIVKAINIIQTEMGILGTTAAEASETISGSVATMKAAWTNWRIGLADENANIEQLTQNLADSIVIVMENVVPRVGQVIATLGTVMASYAPEIAAQLYNGLMATLPEAVRGPVQTAVQTLGEIGAYLAETFGPALQAASELAAPVLDMLSGLFTHMGQQVQAVLVPALDFLGQQFTLAIEAMEPWIAPLGNVAQLLGNILVAALALAAEALGNIMIVFRYVTDVIMDFDAFMNGQPSIIGAAIDGIVAWFTSLPSRILGAIGNLGSLLYSSGQALIQGFINGINAMIGSATAAVSNLVGSVRNYFPFSPAKEGPFSGRGYTTYSGRALVSDFADSIRKSGAKAEAAMRSVMDGVSAEASFSPSFSASPMAATGDNVTNVYIDGSLIGVDAKIARIISDLISAVETSRRMGTVRGLA